MYLFIISRNESRIKKWVMNQEMSYESITPLLSYKDMIETG